MPAIYGVLVAGNFISCVGLWYFKQWGVQLYLASFFGRLIFFLLTDQIGLTFYLGGVISLVFSMILLKFYPRMSPNL